MVNPPLLPGNLRIRLYSNNLRKTKHELRHSSVVEHLLSRLKALDPYHLKKKGKEKTIFHPNVYKIPATFPLTYHLVLTSTMKEVMPLFHR
jgi:hypothetical protein